jgi:hypothetical protein
MFHFIENMSLRGLSFKTRKYPAILIGILPESFFIRGILQSHGYCRTDYNHKLPDMDDRVKLYFRDTTLFNLLSSVHGV